MNNVYVIEGIDALGKSTVVDGLKQKLGFFQVLHFQKPEKLQFYEGAGRFWLEEHPEFASCGKSNDKYIENEQYRQYQKASFRNSMIMATSGARLIYDRWHLGECVYAPLYRGYSGDYVFDLEKRLHLNCKGNVRLILLTEDFSVAKHFVDDGESFDISKREQEQEMFIEAFNKSCIPNKRIICVTDKATGGFRHKEQILLDAITS